jgi:hypothetical protein
MLHQSIPIKVRKELVSESIVSDFTSKWQPPIDIGIEELISYQLSVRINEY